MVKRVCLVSSGTGGHLMPALALGKALRRAGHEPWILTEGKPVERELLARFDCDAEALEVGGRGLRTPWRLLRATLRARRLLRDHDTDLIVGTGGRTTVPACVAARTLGIPVALLEQNATAGRANRLLLPFARRIYCGLPPTRRMRRSLITGMPLREGFGALDRAAARRHLGLNDDSPVVLVTGGSQGARVFNEIVPVALAQIARPLQVLHLTGPGNDDDVRRRYAALDVAGVSARVWPLASDMATCYAAADVVICRGGGATVAELIASGRAAVIVPYPYHRDRQQYHNAEVLARSGAAVVLDQWQLKAETLAAEIVTLLDNGQSEAMGRCASVLASQDACSMILEDLRSWRALD